MSEAIVELRAVNLALGGRPVLEDISFAVAPGRFLGIVGPNGAGKTTLLKLILGLRLPDSGSVSVFGVPPQKLGRGAHRIGYVPQRSEMDRRFPVTVRDVVMMGRVCCIGLLRFPRKSDWEKVDQSIGLVGLSGLEERPFGELSGGEQQRVLLARAMCAETRLLLLDEPTMGLDRPTEEEFYRLLRRLREERGLTILAVSHDLLTLGGLADELICINRQMHIHGDSQQVLSSDQLREAYRCELDFLSH